ncbi:hypothetical protein QEO94_07590 [Kingella negevensis]|uniref:hypothetical protein n=1 Tax=Kingella negevensis TaxID=1522312 RepID=UPI0025427930|nr:hypothetical protein [Kingella negevensis]WII92504.1 hypothetical protein QEO94_07590 [Kingella negevensis]
MKTNFDMSVIIKRNPDNQTYELSMVVHQENGNVEKAVCQTLPELFKKIAEFEHKLPQFNNAVEYQHTDWRELARQNRAKKAA